MALIPTTHRITQTLLKLKLKIFLKFVSFSM
uniref:Uncharacterized protein n=1 Tax=Rhizophora mucronata TaxID=61149 RepID=A0A2P2QYM2_RHIMU